LEKGYSCRVSYIVETLQLNIVNRSADYADALVHVTAINRPGLQLAGFYDYFDPRRMQIMGMVEATYLSSLPPQVRWERLDEFLSRRPVAVILCHGTEPQRDFIELAREYGINLFVSSDDTSECMSKVVGLLKQELAPRITRHGVLVEVHGEGLLIIGESGIGKSETALELVKRGHRLIADDAVEIRRVEYNVLSGSAPEMIRYYMELRGIGVINAREIFGVGAVKPSTRINLVIQLEAWDSSKFYDRLGLESEFTEILGVKVPMVTIPVKPGRNLAVILELAAMNHRQKLMGYDAARDLTERHDTYIDTGRL